MIADEVADSLRELVDLVGATSARIVTDGSANPGAPERTIPLGAGEYLRLELLTCKANVDVDAAIERATRRLRNIRRRWEVARLPEMAVSSSAGRPRGATTHERIVEYLQALAAIDRGTNAFLIRHNELIAAARAPDAVEAARWPLLARRVIAVHSPHSSHGEVVDTDAFAMSFWYEAVLVVLLAEPYAVDFVRYRCRQVARELCSLLPLLEPDPEAPAAIGPRSPTDG